MPERSAKMKRRIFGFHRRVWCPKWTPASSRSCNWGCAMPSLSGFWSAAAVISRATPAHRGPNARSSGVRDNLKRRGVWGVGCGVERPHPTPHIPLTFAKLEPLPRAGAPGLLALDRPWIARQQPLLAQLLAMPVVGEAQRPRDPQPHRPRLAGHATAPAIALHVEGAERVGRGERLLDVGHERGAREIVAQRPAVDVPLPRARRQIHTRHALLAPPDGVPAQLRRDRGHADAPAVGASGCGCCAACGCVGPAYTFSICLTFWRDNVVFGNIPHTAFSITRSGCLASTVFTAVKRSCPIYPVCRKYRFCSGLRPVSCTCSAFTTMTQSPPLMCGVKVGLCLPRSTWARRLARRPSGCPAASTTHHRCSMSSTRCVY